MRKKFVGIFLALSLAFGALSATAHARSKQQVIDSYKWILREFDCRTTPQPQDEIPFVCSRQQNWIENEVSRFASLTWDETDRDFQFTDQLLESIEKIIVAKGFPSVSNQEIEKFIKVQNGEVGISRFFSSWSVSTFMLTTYFYSYLRFFIHVYGNIEAARSPALCMAIIQMAYAVKWGILAWQDIRWFKDVSTRTQIPVEILRDIFQVLVTPHVLKQ
jgi:hypothetical protein